jgi:DNA-binding CsgD family transcriptional regulator
VVRSDQPEVIVGRQSNVGTVHFGGKALISGAEIVFRSIVEQMDDQTAALDFVDLAEQLGISAFIVAELDLPNRIFLNAHSTMDSLWLSYYTDEGFQDVDPFLNRAFSGGGAISVTCGDLASSDITAPKSRLLNHGLKDAGYSRLLGAGYQTQSADVMRWVSLCFEQETPSVEPSAVEAFSCALTSFYDFGRSVGTLSFLNNTLKVPESASAVTPRERDALSFLAAGRRIGQIAFSMGISETMVHRHLTSCQKKLNASTREQLIVKALRHRIVSQ